MNLAQGVKSLSIAGPENGDQRRVQEIVRRLRKAIPEAKIALHFKNPLELLVATILSAQCTDKRVNMVTPALFKKYKTARDYADANPKTFEQEIRSTGFYRAKAKSIMGAAREMVKRFGGKVPNQMEDLVTLPGVGRKTANVILGNAYDTPGLVVDTHMKRIANRLGLTRNQDPVKIEFDLQKIVPEKDWTQFSHLIIWHGRRTCFARKPNCAECSINDLCPSRVVIARSAAFPPLAESATGVIGGTTKQSKVRRLPRPAGKARRGSQ